ncbi:MAG: hypothetical protein K2Y18_02120 [Alphaproteobacteria bacterium]|jgi:hypothetical protein|nr:hypothetical protein [Alphaproteobacteria bacterium]
MNNHPWDLGNIKLLESLVVQNAVFLITGSWAVNHYDPTRIPNDLDILISNKNENIENCVFTFASLEDFASKMEEIKQKLYEISENNGPALKLSCRLYPFPSGNMYNFDILSPKQTQSFEELWERSEKGIIFGKVPVRFISKRDLIHSKREAIRNNQNDIKSFSGEDLRKLIINTRKHLNDIERLEKL